MTCSPCFLFIEEYFNDRQFTATETYSIQDETTVDSYRLNQFSDLEEMLNLNILKVESIPIVQAIDTENEITTVTVYEWVKILYGCDDNDTIEEMEYANQHELQFTAAPSGEYSLLATTDNESDWLDSIINNEDIYIPEDENSNNFSVSKAGLSNFYVGSVIAYADTWVKHEYGSTGIPSKYNPTYGYYLADCANYVSQCLSSGRVPYDYGSGKSTTKTDQWWFDTSLVIPGQETSYDASVQPWRYVKSFVTYFKSKGYAEVNATASTVFPGNPVYMLESNGGSSNHVTICVGYNAAGTPIINGHNRDVYHLPYTMAGSGTLKTIQIADKNLTYNTPASARAITLSNANSYSYYTVLPDNELYHYYKFTPTATGTYRFYTTGSTNTAGAIYLSSQSSNGKTLYMYELASDDNSGSSLNFDFTVSLTSGKDYFVRVKSGYYNNGGTYTFNCSKTS